SSPYTVDMKTNLHKIAPCHQLNPAESNSATAATPDVCQHAEHSVTLCPRGRRSAQAHAGRWRTARARRTRTTSSGCVTHAEHGVLTTISGATGAGRWLRCAAIPVRLRTACLALALSN